MRCPSCGTENAPGSRFCGGCGARLAASAQRVAPTQKISDDASFPQRPVPASAGHHGQAVVQPSAGPRLVAPPAQYASGPPAAQSSAAPPPRAISSAPPGVYAQPPPASRPPAGRARQLQPRSHTSQLDDPSRSMPIIARRPWRLIIVVLLIDLGLAAAGGWLLSEGLGGKPGAPNPPPRSSAPDQRPPGSR